MEVRATRPRANRAVAALQTATDPLTSTSPLLPCTTATLSLVTAKSMRDSRRRRGITRYHSFEELCRAQQKPDTCAALRSELERKLPRPSPRNSVASVGRAVLQCILEFLGLMSRGAAEFARTCRAVHTVRLHIMELDAVVVVPMMVPATTLARESVQRAVLSYLSARSNQVRSLVLHRDGLGAVQRESKDGTPVPPLVLPMPWVLQLVAKLSYLTVLDLRHVRGTESNHSRVMHYFLSDLHIAAAGTLHTLKIDVELMRYWAPGWWRRHANLTSLVIGSRYRAAETPAAATTTTPTASGSSSSAPTQLVLPSDFYSLMREEGKQWRLKLWEPLGAESLKELLLPAGGGAAFVGVAELLVNMHHNEQLLEWPDAIAAVATANTAVNVLGSTDSPQDVRGNAASRKVGAAGVGAASESFEGAMYPLLTTLTLVDVQARPEAAAEVFQSLQDAAPRLVRFNVCDSVRSLIPGEAPKKRHVKA